MLLYFILASLLPCNAAASLLIGVVEISRHGARAPTTFQKWDNLEKWPYGPGELTAEGMRQHYLIGSYLRDRYIDTHKLLSPNYSSSEILIYSTDINRTLISAICQLQGLYPDNSGPTLSTSQALDAIPPISVSNLSEVQQSLGLSALPFSTQIVPVHSNLLKYDLALSPSTSCPYYDYLTDYKMTLPELSLIYNNYSDVISTIMQVMNYSKSQAEKNARKISDSLTAHDFMNYPFPSGFNMSFYQRLRQLANKIKNFNYFQPEALARLAGSEIMEKVVENLMGMTEENNKVKFFFYSAHDTTLSYILAYLGLDYEDLPPYASTLIFELYKEDDVFSVNLKYNGVDMEIPTCGAVNCSLEVFEMYVKAKGVDDTEEVCSSNTTQVNWSLQTSAVIKEFTIRENISSTWISVFIFMTVIAYCLVFIMARVLLKPTRKLLASG